MKSASGRKRGWTYEIRHAPDFYIGVAITLLVLFLPPVVIFSIEWIYQTRDYFPGASIVLPWAVGLSCVGLIGGLALLYFAIRLGAYPGSFLYQLTHFRPRRR